jgi:hypothetical protein
MSRTLLSDWTLEGLRRKQGVYCMIYTWIQKQDRLK